MAKKKVMKKENKEKEGNSCDCKEWKGSCCCGGKGGCGAIYGLGLIGAAIYFISNTSGFWNIVLAILKSIVWPVFLVLKLFGM